MNAGLRSGFAFPILFNREVLGVVEFFGQPGQQPDTDQFRMFESLGSQIGQFVERKRGEQALAESARLASLVGDVGFALTQGDSLPDVLRLCAEAIVRNIGAALARIWTLNAAAGVLELQASAGMYTHLNGPHGRVPIGQFKIGRIAQERRPHLTNAVIGDPYVENQEWARPEGMVAFAGYPLLVDQRLVGVVALFARHALNDAVLGSLASIADQIALGIDRKRTERALQVAQQRLEQVVSSSPSVLFTLAIENDEIRGLSWISENVRALFNFSAQEALKPRWWLDHIHPEDRERILTQTPTDLIANGGHVGVYSEVGVGSTFRAYFPRVEKEEARPNERTAESTLPRGNETILLAEDEDAVRALSRHILRGCGYTVLDARDGTDALRVAAEHPGRIDMLVTDVVMPRTSGRELVERLSETRPWLKVLFLSGYTDDAIVRHGILEAEVAFLQKPFTGMALAQKVREVLDKR